MSREQQAFGIFIMTQPFTRRTLLTGLGAAAMSKGFAASALPILSAPGSLLPLQEFRYDQIALRDPTYLTQRGQALDVLTHLDDDSVLHPFRAMNNQPAPGVSLAGWYEWNPAYNHHHSTSGLAPGHAFGQWTSALARFHAASRFGGSPGEPGLAEQATRLHAGLAQCIGPRFFAQARFAGYTLDKLTCGLLDAHRLLHDPAALPTLDRTLDAALPSLPPRALDREVQWRPGAGIDWMWDETYTLPENFYLASAAGADTRYLHLAEQYLDDTTFFAPLARAENVLGDHHAYSYVNALCSAMQAYLVSGSTPHLRAAQNGFRFLQAQSFATGGWGPEELLRTPGYDELFKSLTASRNSFETPCGSYAHAKLTRYLLRATGDGLYGDSMERVLLNTLAGALPLQPDGRSFYSQDCTFTAKRVYSEHIWPCCSGTLPQVLADRGINSFFHQPGHVWINLYQTSELRWEETRAGRSGPFALQVSGPYLEEGKAELLLNSPAPAPFTLHLRIPAWAGVTASLHLNGRTLPLVPAMGFVTVDRTWSTHDRVELDFAPSLRLETFPSNGGPGHPDLVALLWGPLVLFALRKAGETGPLSFVREDLLGAARRGPGLWSATDTGGTPRIFVPFTAVGQEIYSTYVQLAPSLA